MDHGFLVGIAELRGEGLACPFVAGRGVGGGGGGSQGSRSQTSKARASVSLASDVTGTVVTGWLPRPWHPAVPTHLGTILLPGCGAGPL